MIHPTEAASTSLLADNFRCARRHAALESYDNFIRCRVILPGKVDNIHDGTS